MILVATQIGSGKLSPPLPANAPEEIQHLMKACFQVDPENRPSTKALCEALDKINSL